MPNTEEQRLARTISIEYIQKFGEIEKSRSNSLAFLGSPGAGKTHLTIAIANALLNQGISVRYMQYREALTTLVQVRFDEASYIKEIEKWKRCRVLLIDDLFKGAIRRDGTLGQEGTIIFEIVNHRYMAGKPVLISSELTMDKIVDLDEAVGTRLAELSKGRIVEFVGKHQNNRMRKEIYK